MKDKYNSENRRLIDRRKFLQWATSVGLISIFPSTISDVAEAKAQREKPVSIPNRERGNPKSEVFQKHITEFPSIQERINKSQRIRNPNIFYSDFLEDILKNNPNKAEFSIVVRTIGEQNTITSNRYERKVHGWSPSNEEVEILSIFGTIGFVPDFISTTLTLKNIRRKDISKIAALPFVVDVNYDPPYGGSGSHDIDADSLRSTSYYWFTSVEDNYDISLSNLRCGVIDTGYRGGGNGSYSSSIAESMIDFSLANSFSGEPWDEPHNSHGDNVADTIAHMLQDGHSNLYVPLRISNEEGDPNWSDNIRAAIEYSLRNDIDVINISQQTYNTYSYCNFQFCSELYSYIGWGYIPISISGNYGETASVTQPGASWLNIGVGGIDNGDCSEDGNYRRDSNSNYGNIDYRRCNYCDFVYSGSSQHSPQVYGCYHTQTDAGAILNGTSYAAPQVTAAALIMQSNGLYQYQQTEEIFREMDFYGICTSNSAREGQLLDAYDAYYRTS